VSIAIKGVAALILAALLVEVLWRASRAESQAQDACLGPYVDPGGRITTFARMLGWVAAVALAVTALAGYVALAWFLAQQLLWAAALFSMATIAIAVIDALAGQMRRNDTAVARFAHLQVGLPQRALEQAGVLIGGGLKAIAIVVAVVLLLAPWGVESGSLFEALQGVIFGFSVGGVSISISSMLAAAALFAAGIVVTRAVQRWLESDFLPTTGMDAGLRNSIRTGVGYLGSLVAAAIGLSALGLSLDRLAIVAGALSVGIGFGLQSIVNNFVSGLILLWERPIRVGDWVVVGSDEGIVRRIHVRATEIATFDRSTVIIPNSTFISGVVKNKVLADRSGRVMMTVKVAPTEDPERVRDVLVATVNAHPAIMPDPGAIVQLSEFGAQSLDFLVLGFVPDVGNVGAVSSELRFAILKRFREENIAQPSTASTLTIDTAQLENALDQLARSRDPGRPRPVERGRAARQAGERG
jgi:small-conductance mechanosensitive channel